MPGIGTRGIRIIWHRCRSTPTTEHSAPTPWVNVRHPRWEPEPLRWLGVRGSRWILAAADSYEFRTNREARTAVALARKLRND